MTKNTSTAPEAVMAQRRISAQEIKTVNRNLFFYMKFKFYKFDRHAAYVIDNDLQNTNYDGRDQETADATGISRERITGREQSENQRRQTVNEYLANPLTTVILPLPPELFESYSVDFEQAGVGLIGRTLLDAYINGGLSVGEMEEGLRRLASTVGGNLVEALPENLQSTAEIFRGKIKNPVYNTVFRGVPIRSHDFSWKIAPESPEEQADIEGVLKALRKHSLPAFERSGEINNIMYPDFCKIELTPAVFKFPKPMFVSALSINHAPEGLPAFFHDGKPVGYEIKMRLTEATALVRQDIVEDEEDQQTT